MTISILTLFPEMFDGPFAHSIVRKAIEDKILKINLVNVRDFGIGKHKVVDDRPYGGGTGMVLRVDVLEKAISETKKKFSRKNRGKTQKIILLDASGKTYNQKKAQELSKLDHLILVCGHYEGFDARIENFVDEEISIGDFILTGGEIPAMIISDSVARLKKGVLSKDATAIESFSDLNGAIHLEFPQYTRPEKFKKMSIPPVLKSGNHEEIKKWRTEKAQEKTKEKRPDLIEN